jgi:hypothetical protein
MPPGRDNDRPHWLAALDERGCYLSNFTPVIAREHFGFT